MTDLSVALEEYVSFLEDRMAETASFLFVHGQTCSKKDFDKGKELRDKIANLKANNSLNFDQGAVVSIQVQCHHCGYPIFINGTPTENATISLAN